eukprot:1216571-Rhodomonas_salina.2
MTLVSPEDDELRLSTGGSTISVGASRRSKSKSISQHLPEGQLLPNEISPIVKPCTSGCGSGVESTPVVGVCVVEDVGMDVVGSSVVGTGVVDDDAMVVIGSADVVLDVDATEFVGESQRKLMTRSGRHSSSCSQHCRLESLCSTQV